MVKRSAPPADGEEPSAKRAAAVTPGDGERTKRAAAVTPANDERPKRAAAVTPDDGAPAQKPRRLRRLPTDALRVVADALGGLDAPARRPAPWAAERSGDLMRFSLVSKAHLSAARDRARATLRLLLPGDREREAGALLRTVHAVIGRGWKRAEGQTVVERNCGWGAVEVRMGADATALISDGRLPRATTRMGDPYVPTIYSIRRGSKMHSFTVSEALPRDRCSSFRVDVMGVRSGFTSICLLATNDDGLPAPCPAHAAALRFGTTRRAPGLSWNSFTGQFLLNDGENNLRYFDGDAPLRSEWRGMLALHYDPSAQTLRVGSGWAWSDDVLDLRTLGQYSHLYFALSLYDGSELEVRFTEGTDMSEVPGTLRTPRRYSG